MLYQRFLLNLLSQLEVCFYKDELNYQNQYCTEQDISNISISDKPSPPTGPAKVEWRTQDTLELQWSKSESDGGAKIEEYIVERKEVDKKSWRQIVTCTQTNIEVR